MRSHSTTLLALLFALTGCFGEGVMSSGVRGDLAGAPGGPTGDDIEGGGVITAAKVCTPEERDPGVTPLRRLTRFEYDRVVKDLLGVSATPAPNFEPESELLGFDNDATLIIPPELAGQQVNAAEELANAFDVSKVLPCDPSQLGADACGLRFIERFGLRAFRRPLDPSEVDTYRKLFDAGRAGEDFHAGVRLVVQAMLQSPHFLYRPEVRSLGQLGAVVRLDPFELASRLSFFLWSSMPDDELLAQAGDGRFANANDVMREARRMLQDRRAKETVQKFHKHWLELHKLDDLAKDAQLYPQFAAAKPLLQEEAERFIESIFFEGGTATDLLKAPHTYRNQALAGYYGEPGPATSNFVKVATNPTQRAGVFGLGAFLAVQSGPVATSPVLRGVFVRRHMLCGNLPDPPPDATAAVKPPDPSLTTRERYAQHSTDPACAGCHKLIDGIGFGLEDFDTLGRRRTTENNKPIDASGWLVGAAEADGDFVGGAGLGQKLAEAEVVRGCMVKQWFLFTHGRSETPLDKCSVQHVGEQWKHHGYKMEELLVALTQTDAFLKRRVAEVTP